MSLLCLYSYLKTNSFTKVLKFMPYYAVAKGKNVGIFSTWPECQASVNGFASAKFRKFNSHEDAKKFVEENRAHSSTNRMANKRAFPEEEIIPKRPAFGDGDLPVVYTDGACSFNGRSRAKAGFGVYWGDNHPDNLSLPVSGIVATNNRAEYEAVLAAIKQARDKGHDRLLIRTDSKLLISSMDNWIQKWKNNDWKTADGKEVRNKDLLEAIDGMRTHVNFKFEHVNGHVGIHGNEMADQLARLGAQKFLAQRRLSHGS